MREERFNTGSITLNIAEGPLNGPPLVLLHGIMMRWQVFEPVLPVLSQSWQVIVPDLRGHGRSDRAPDRYCGEDYAQDMTTLLRERIQQPAVLFGHSLGGMITLWLAAKCPELVRAAVIADSPIARESVEKSHYPALFRNVLAAMRRDLDVDDLARALGEIQVALLGPVKMRLRNLPYSDPAFLRWWARSLKDCDPDVLEMALDGRSAQAWEGRKLFDQVKCPVLVLQASPHIGGLMSDGDVQYAKSVLKNVIHVKFDTLGHPLFMWQADPVLRVVLNFLGSL